MERRRAFPQSRQFNERQIRRRHEHFQNGLLLQEDTEGTEVVSGLTKAINVRCFKNSVDGRPGTILLTPADFGLLVTDAGDATIAVAVQSGELYAASGAVKSADTVPSIGHVFMVYGEGDTTDNALETAKGYAVRKYDCFKVTNNAAGSEAVRYLGNLREPAMPGFGDTPSTEITASQSGTTITKTGGPDFTADHISQYFAFYTGNRRVIKRIISTTQVEVDASATVASQTKCQIQGRRNATLYHRGTGRLVCLMGKRIYLSTTLPLAGWTEIARNSVFRPSDSAMTKIFEFGDDAILMGPNGIFIIKLTARAPYYYKANSPVIETLPTDIALAAGKKHRYKYTVTGVRLEGTGNITHDRTDTDDVTLIKETGSCKENADGKDYGDIWTDEPVGDGSETYGKLISGTVAVTYQNPSGYNFADMEMVLVVNSTSYTVAMDGRGCQDMGEVAQRWQDAARTYADLRDVEFEFDTDHWEVRTGKNDTITYCTAVSAGAGTDMSSNMKLRTGEASDPSIPAYYNAANVVYYLTYPENTADITHYGVYRGEDFAKDEESGDIMAWVGDIPVAKAFTGSFSGALVDGVYTGTLTLTDGSFETEDTTAIVFAEDGSYCEIKQVLTAATATAEGSVATIASQSMAIGGGTVFTASQTGTAITIASGMSLDADTHEGYIIFWTDGRYSIVKSVTDTSTGVAAWAEEHASQGATIRPVSRVFSDLISDEDLENRLRAWPLQVRYWEPLPEGAVNLSTPGWLFTATRGSKRYNYGRLAQLWSAGYYNPAYQKSEKILDGIQSLRGKDGSVLVRGSTRVYMLSTSSPAEVGDPRVGESVSGLPDPNEISKIGGTIGDGAVQDLEDGGEILVTSEPEVRTFDGDKYQGGLTFGRIKKGALLKAKPVFIAAYQSICGYFLWFEQKR